MIRLLGYLTLVTAAAGGGAYVAYDFGWRPWGGSNRDPVVHRVNQPTLEQVQKLADLVTLRVPISDVHVTELEGVIGGIKLAMAIRGEVDFATDLAAAHFTHINADTRAAELTLSRPTPRRPRLDHEATRVLAIERSGLWRWLPGQAGERTLTNRAMIAAQRWLGETAQRDDLQRQACAHAQRVITEFFNTMQWQVAVTWQGDDAAAVAKIARP